MKTSMAVATLFLALSTITIQAQTFSCNVTSSGGIAISGSNPHDRVVRCDVDCGYWTTSGAEQHQRCNPAMQPNSSNVQYCAFNLNNAKTVIGVSQSCH